MDYRYTNISSRIYEYGDGKEFKDEESARKEVEKDIASDMCKLGIYGILDEPVIHNIEGKIQYVFAMKGAE